VFWQSQEKAIRSEEANTSARRRGLLLTLRIKRDSRRAIAAAGASGW
jgi:hypothetical protein